MNVGLNTFLAFAGFMVIVAIVGLCAALYTSTSKLHDTVVSLSVMSNNIRAVQDMESDLLAHSRESLLWKLTQHEIYKSKKDQARVEYLSSLEQGRIYVGTPAEADLFRQIEEFSKTYFALREKFENQDISPERAAELISPYTDHLLALLRSFTALNLEDVKSSQALAAMDNQVANKTAIFATALSTFALLGTLLFTWRHLYSPLRRMIRCIKNLATGQLPVVIDSRIREVRMISATLHDSAQKISLQRESHLRHIAAVAHDIKNPLSAIKASVELVEESSCLDDDSRELIQIIHRQSDYLAAMVSDFLDTTRAQSGALTIRKAYSDLSKTVGDAARLFANFSKTHIVQTEMPDRPVFCYFDCTRISQVLNNLISNAIKYSPSGGVIHIVLREEMQRVTVSVTDPGVGIDEAEFDSIFQPFARSRHTAELIPGVGLGLFTSREIVSAHGGQLAVKSSIGQGSTFSVSIPTNGIEVTKGVRSFAAVPQTPPLLAQDARG